MTYTGKKLVAVTQYGLTVSWDGLTMVELELPSGDILVMTSHFSYDVTL